MQLTDMAIRAHFPDALDSYVSALAKLEPQLAKHGLNEPITFCMFLAQAAHECGGFTIVEESGNYSAERLLEIFPVTDPGTAYRRFTPGQARHTRVS